MKVHVVTFAHDTTLAALDYALDVVSVSGGSITAVHVVGPPDRTLGRSGEAERTKTASGTGSGDDEQRTTRLDASYSGEDPRERRHDAGIRQVTGDDRTVVTDGEEILSRERAHATSASVSIDTELLYGDPYRAVVDFAESDGANLVVAEKPAGDDSAGARVTRKLSDDAPLPVVVVPG